MDLSTAASIMVIGGDSHFNYLLRRYVRMSAHGFIYADLCEEAPLIALREQPVAIILEVDHPDSLGWRIYQSLRSNQATAHIPIVLCSWQDDNQAALPGAAVPGTAVPGTAVPATTGPAAGANVFLRMPILFADFTSALAEVGVT